MNGWTVGGGAEWMLNRNWLIRGEYRYADFGTLRSTFFNTAVTPGGFVGSDTIATDIHVRTHLATIGIAYKFDWARPVVAKY
jgi:outer membrane immunogenic protein